MRNGPAILVSTLAASCGGPALVSPCDVQLAGGTPEQEDLATEVLCDFQRHTASELVLRDVMVDASPLPEGSVAGYDLNSASIYLDPDLAGFEFEEALRHELCHALDAQEDLSAKRDEDLLSLAPGLGEPLDSPLYEEPAFERMEAFAILCELGPEASGLLGTHPCEGEPSELTPLFDWMSGEVWQGGQWFPANARLGTQQEWFSPFTLESLAMDQGTAEAVPAIRFLAIGPGPLDQDWFTLGLDSGSVLDGDFLELPSDPLEKQEMQGRVAFDRTMGWPDGPAMGPAHVELDGVGDVRRVAVRWTSDDTWQTVGGACPDAAPNSRSITVDDRLWFAWWNADRLWWAEVVEGPP